MKILYLKELKRIKFDLFYLNKERYFLSIIKIIEIIKYVLKF